MSKDKILIPGKTIKHLRPGQQPVIRVSPDCYDMLVDVANESVMPLNRVATAIITQAIQKNLVELERKVEE